MAGRDRQPQHVGQRAPVAVRDRPGKARDLGGEHGLGRHHPLQEGKAALMIAGICPPQQITADQPPGEPHPDPAARYGVQRQPLRNQVVEGPVEMRQRNVDGHPRDRQADSCGRDGAALPRPRACAPSRWTCHGSVLPERSGSQGNPRLRRAPLGSQPSRWKQRRHPRHETW